MARSRMLLQRPFLPRMALRSTTIPVGSPTPSKMLISAQRELTSVISGGVGSNFRSICLKWVESQDVHGGAEKAEVRPRADPRTFARCRRSDLALARPAADRHS